MSVVLNDLLLFSSLTALVTAIVIAAAIDRSADTKTFKHEMDAYNNPDFYSQLGKDPRDPCAYEGTVTGAAWPEAVALAVWHFNQLWVSNRYRVPERDFVRREAVWIDSSDGRPQTPDLVPPSGDEAVEFRVLAVVPHTTLAERELMLCIYQRRRCSSL